MEMTAGLQIWRQYEIGKGHLTLDLTSRCLNVFGYIDTGIWFGFNESQWPPFDNVSYKDDNIFEWKSINVPEFSMGNPFYNVSYKLLDIVFSEKGQRFRKWVFSEVSHVNNDQEMMDLLTEDDECYLSQLTPDIKIEGSTLHYKYNEEWANNVFGNDRLFVLIGGFRISYGVL